MPKAIFYLLKGDFNNGTGKEALKPINKGLRHGYKGPVQTPMPLTLTLQSLKPPCVSMLLLGKAKVKDPKP